MPNPHIQSILLPGQVGFMTLTVRFFERVTSVSMSV